MRWDNLAAPPVEGVPDRAAPAAPPLPLALPGAVARTLDTPGFAGTRYHELYRSGAYAPQPYQRELTARVRIAARRHGLPRGEGGDDRRQPDPAPPPPPAEQLSLP